ncbi:MAG: hypothetical protein H0T39_00765 [Actinobacteria bacterium]|nr:hypothetical protein [Actinomycetota bacterium]
MTLVDQWRSIEVGLSPRWDEARLLLAAPGRASLDRAASLLRTAEPALSPEGVRFRWVRDDEDGLAALLERLDAEGAGGRLELLSTRERAAVGPSRRAARTGPATLAAAWEGALAELPPDWSDLYGEIELGSTDYLDRAALMLSPVNPSRAGGPGFRFRCARVYGYGASAEMVRRCLERCDAEGITGQVRILRTLSDTRPVATQGPVWYVGGKAV